MVIFVINDRSMLLKVNRLQKGGKCLLGWSCNVLTINQLWFL